MGRHADADDLASVVPDDLGDVFKGMNLPPQNHVDAGALLEDAHDLNEGGHYISDRDNPYQGTIIHNGEPPDAVTIQELGRLLQIGLR